MRFIHHSVALSVAVFALLVVGVNCSKPRRARSPDKTSGDLTTGGLLGVGDDSNDSQNDPTKPRFVNQTGFLPLPPGYNKLTIPLGNISKSVFVFVQFAVRQVVDVDTKNEIVELDTELVISWIDWQIWKYFIEDKEAQEKAKTGPEEVTLDSEFLKYIWKPDIFIEEMASVDRTALLSKLVTLKFLVRNDVIPGAIFFKSRQTLKLRCDMGFHFYPADTQECTFNIRSFSYTQDQLFLTWDELRQAWLDEIEDSNFDFQIADVEPGGEVDELFITSQTRLAHRNYSALSFTLKIRRNVTYHLVQTYLPSVLLVLITWLCFLLPTDMVEARIGISMTTLLTLTAMFTAVREQAPEVSYTMAIDIWMVFCIFLIFLALVLFTVIYWMNRQFRTFKDAEGEKEAKTNGDVPVGHVPPKEEVETYLKIMKICLRYAFLVFVILFITFLTAYSLWVFLGSGYYDWEPSPKYNAVEQEDGSDSNKLYSRKETRFAEDDEDKIPTNDFRYLEIVEEVIQPKLAELEE